MPQCQPIWNLGMLMMRVKQQHVQQSEPSHRDKDCRVSFGVLCSSATFGIMVVLGQVGVAVSGPTLIPSLVMAAIISILSGLCLAEFLTSQSQGLRSVYSCCYQTTCELLAFLIGWTSLLYLSAALASISRVLSATIDELSDHKLTNFFHSTISSSCPDLLSVLIILLITLLILTGVNESSACFVYCMPLALVVAVFSTVMIYMANDKGKWTALANYQIEDSEELLSGAAISTYCFIGAHSLFRIHPKEVHRRIPSSLGPLNAACFVFTFAFSVLLAYSMRFTPLHSAVPVLELFRVRECLSSWYSVGSLSVASLLLLGFEACHPLHATAEDLAGDGLLLRSFARPWQPYCASVPSFAIHVLTVITTSVLALVLRLVDVLRVAVAGPLFVNSVVCLLVLLQRYEDRDSWQYEPMLQQTSELETRKRTKKSASNKGEVGVSLVDEPQPRHQDSNGHVRHDCHPEFFKRTSAEVCVAESDSSSETDIDAIVAEYKEQVRVAALTHLEGPITDSLVQEPTVATTLRAKLAVAGLFITYLTLAFIVSIGSRTKSLGHPALLTVGVASAAASLLLLVVLARLPQNKFSTLLSNKPQARVPLMPWIPGIAALLSLCLLAHVLIDVWHVLLIWTLIGFSLYFVYGVHSSTAATSFSVTQQLTLQPLPCHGNSCVPQVVPSHRRFSRKKRRMEEVDTVLINH